MVTEGQKSRGAKVLPVNVDIYLLVTITIL